MMSEWLTDNSNLPSFRTWLKSLEDYLAHVNPSADHWFWKTSY
jgi:hypothetical protein